MLRGWNIGLQRFMWVEPRARASGWRKVPSESSHVEFEAEVVVMSATGSLPDKTHRRWIQGLSWHIACFKRRLEGLMHTHVCEG